MGTKVRQRAGSSGSLTDSPKAEVGEIDTRAPFESVKAAVSLFGESVKAGAGAGGGRKPKPSSAPQTERVLAKETELHLAQKELSKYKDQLDNAETTRVQALAELDRAKIAVDELTIRLNEINKSKEIAVKATEQAKSQTAELELAGAGNDGSLQKEMEGAREQYVAALADLDAAKQELRKLKKDFESSLEEKLLAVKQESDAKHHMEMNTQKAAELAQEIVATQDSLGHVKAATEQARLEETKIRQEKDSARESYKQNMEETVRKIEELKKGFDPLSCESLEGKLAETEAEIEAVRKETEERKAADLEAVMGVNTELEGAKEMLRQVADEELSLRSTVAAMTTELATVKASHADLARRDAETEAAIGDLQAKLQRCRAELEAAAAAEANVSESSGELREAMDQMAAESSAALQEAEIMKKTAADLSSEASAARAALSAAETRLAEALKDAESAKAAESTVLARVTELSERTQLARASTSSEGSAKIVISKEEFEALSRKAEESAKLSDMKVAAAMAQVEAVKASESEAIARLESARKEMEEMEAQTEEALKRAEMAEAAKKAVEGELKRWRDKEQKRAAEVAERILADSQEQEVEPPAQTETLALASPPKPHKKKTLQMALSAIFHKKKGQSDGGSPSYLPGEKHT